MIDIKVKFKDTFYPFQKPCGHPGNNNIIVF